MRKRFSYLGMALSLSGCASWQLNHNTGEISGTIDNIIKDQVVFNIARFIADPTTNPSQAIISSGSVSTTNQVSVNWFEPLSKALTTTSKFVQSDGPSVTAIGSSLLPASTLTSAGSNQSSQNWALSLPSSDPIRRMRALYRYAISAPGADLCKEYVLPLTSYPDRNESSTVLNQQDAQKDESEKDNAAWKAAKNADVSLAYEKYIRFFPHGRHVTAAKLRVLQIREFQGETPSMNEEELDWKSALTSDTVESYKKFLATYDANDDPHVKQAKRRIEQIGVAAIIRAESPQKMPIARAIPDGTFLIEPSCVICSRAANVGNIAASPAASRVCPNGGGDFYVNPRLKDGWIYVGDNAEPPPSARYIGQAQGYRLYTTDSDAYNQFVIFVLEAAAGGAKAGSSSSSKSASPQTQLLSIQ